MGKFIEIIAINRYIDRYGNQKKNIQLMEDIKKILLSCETPKSDLEYALQEVEIFLPEAVSWRKFFMDTFAK